MVLLYHMLYGHRRGSMERGRRFTAPPAQVKRRKDSRHPLRKKSTRLSFSCKTYADPAVFFLFVLFFSDPPSRLPSFIFFLLCFAIAVAVGVRCCWVAVAIVVRIDFASGSCLWCFSHSRNPKFRVSETWSRQVLVRHEGRPVQPLPRPGLWSRRPERGQEERGELRGRRSAGEDEDEDDCRRLCLPAMIAFVP